MNHITEAERELAKQILNLPAAPQATQETHAWAVAELIATYRATELARTACGSSPLLETLRGHATEIHKATGEQLSAEVQAEVTVYGHGLVGVRYTAACGELLGKGVSARRCEFADSPAVAAAQLVETLLRDRVADKIRVQFLRQRAAELGFDIVRKAGRGGES